MISIEEKEKLIKETMNRAKEISGQGLEDESKAFDAIDELMRSYSPLMHEYNKEIMEVINPSNEFVLPILIYVLKASLAALETELNNHENSGIMKMILQCIESTYQSVSFIRPD